MSIRVYNRYLDLLFEIDRYQSLQFKRNYHGIGDFELHVNRYINGADTLEKGHLIALNKRNNKVGIIQSKEIALDEGGKESENFKLTGYTLDGLMQRRITEPPSHTSHDRISGSAETVMKHYVYNNFIDTTKERQMPFLEIADSLGRGSHVKYESRYKTVSDELEKISINSGLGWGIFADFNTKKLIFDVIERKDLTQDNAQGNNPVFFSPEFETIKSQEFIDSDNELRNVGFVGGQGEGVDRKIVKIGDVSGWNRIETFVDARDISDEDEETEEELTDEEVEELLLERGQKKMADMETIFTLEAEILSPTTESPFIYEKDYDLGDYVDVVNKSWNLTMTAPITEITEIYEPDGFRLDAVFGRNRPTLISKLNDKFNELEGIEKQEAPERVSVSYSKENKEYTEQKSQEDREYTDEQDKVYDEKAQEFTEEKSNEALNDAIDEAIRQDELVRQDAEEYANQAKEDAVSESVAREIFYERVAEVNEQIESIVTDVSEKAPIEYIDGELKVIEDKVDEYDLKIDEKADKTTVYTIEETDNKLDNYVGVTEFTTEIDGVVKDIEDQGTRIGQNEEAIELKANEDYVDNVENSLNTKIGNVEVTAEGAKISASEVRADLDGLEIGGVNYVRHFNSGAWSINETHTDIISDTKVEIKGEQDSWKTITLDINGEKNTTYTFSVKGNGFFGIGQAKNANVSGWVEFDGRTTYTFTTSKDESNVRIQLSNNKNEGKFVFIKPQLEKGNRATDWSPAPEDIEGHIEEVSGRVETLDASVETLAGEVSLKASQSVVDSLEGRVSDAEGELSVLPGEIEAKVSRDGVVGAINASPEELLIDFGRVKMEGALEARHIKSLNGLNVGDQFIVDGKGNVVFAGKLQAKEGYFGDNLRLVDGKLEIVRPDGAVSTTDGMVKGSQSVGGINPMYMSDAIETSGYRYNAFDELSGYFFSKVGRLDGRDSMYRDVRNSDYRSSVRIQRFYFVHAARYLIITYRSRTGEGQGYSGNAHRHLALVYDEDDSKLVDHNVPKNTIETVDLIVDLGPPKYNSRWIDFRIGFASGWGNKNDYIRFRINNVVQTDFL